MKSSFIIVKDYRGEVIKIEIAKEINIEDIKLHTKGVFVNDIDEDTDGNEAYYIHLS